jgi:hypothetical protein
MRAAAYLCGLERKNRHFEANDEILLKYLLETNFAQNAARHVSVYLRVVCPSSNKIFQSHKPK